MKDDFYFKNLIKVLQDRIPQRGKLAEVLTELLGIEKEAVYRRLRGSVPFSFQEVHKIAIHLGFSLDSIAENFSPLTREMTVLLIDFLNPKKGDYKRIEEFTMNAKQLKDDPDSEAGAIGTVIPLSLYLPYEHISKFNLYKLSHQFGHPQKIISYTEVKISEHLKEINRAIVENVHNAPKSVYVIDRKAIECFINDVLFYYDIRLITREDVLKLKDDLQLLLNELERYTNNGCFDTGNKVEIYLANVHLDANYHYIDATAYKFTMVRSFTFSDSYSFDEVVFRNLKNWLNFLKRTSTFISGGNVAERISFFEQQRKLVDSM
jgi:DNA-binding phage protein